MAGLSRESLLGFGAQGVSMGRRVCRGGRYTYTKAATTEIRASKVRTKFFIMMTRFGAFVEEEVSFKVFSAFKVSPSPHPSQAPFVSNVCALCTFRIGCRGEEEVMSGGLLAS